MKISCMVFMAALLAACGKPAPDKLILLWQTPAVLKVPESVLPDPQRQVLYVSNIDGETWSDDGKGSIARLSPEGAILDAEWVSGLRAPKGMGMKDALLYVADLDRVVVIDIDQSRILKEIPVPGAARLNDLTVDAAGAVYVTDSQHGKIFVLEADRPRVFFENLKWPNGILAHEGKLYVLQGQGLYRIEPDKTLTAISDDIGQVVDGVEPLGGNEFIVSRWGGALYRVRADGSHELLLDTSGDEINAADIGYDARKRVIYVPTFFKNSVAAYRLRTRSRRRTG